MSVDFQVQRYADLIQRSPPSGAALHLTIRSGFKLETSHWTLVKQTSRRPCFHSLQASFYTITNLNANANYYHLYFLKFNLIRSFAAFCH